MHCMAVEIKNEIGISAELVNIGGGIGVGNPPDDKLRDLDPGVKSLYADQV